MKRILALGVCALLAAGCDVFLSSGSVPCWHDEDCPADEVCAANVCVPLFDSTSNPGQVLAKPDPQASLGECSFSLPDAASQTTLACATQWKPEAETYYAPLFWRSAPSGQFDLLDGQDRPFGPTFTGTGPVQPLLSVAFGGDSSPQLDYLLVSKAALWRWSSSDKKLVHDEISFGADSLAASSSRQFIAATRHQISGFKDNIQLYEKLANKRWNCSVGYELPIGAVRTIPSNDFIGIIVGGKPEATSSLGIVEYFYENVQNLPQECAPDGIDRRDVDGSFASEQKLLSLAVSRGGVLTAAVMSRPGEENILRVYADHEGSWSELMTVDGRYSTVAFSPVERDAWVMAAGREDGLVEFFEIDEDPQGPSVVPFLLLDAFAGDNAVSQKEIKRITFSPDGRFLALSNDSFIKVYTTLGITHGD